MIFHEAVSLSQLDLLDGPEVIAWPHALYRRLREQGAVLWLPTNGAWVITRHAAVQQALCDEGFAPLAASAPSLGTPRSAEMARPRALTADDWLEALAAEQVQSHLIRPYKRVMRRRAEERLVQLAGWRGIDAMSQLITPILTAVATDLARTTPPAPQLDHDATAELIGPSDSTELAAPRSGSGGGNVVADALGNVVALLATRPALWQLLLGNRDRVPAAVAECLRLAPPLHWASRVTTRLVRLGGAEIPAHSRVLILLASAYRDERHWVDPEAFRLDRPLMGHHRPPTVTFTWDNSLLRLQAEALVHAMLDHLAHMELAGPSLPRIHRAHRGHLDLPICLIPHL